MLPLSTPSFQTLAISYTFLLFFFCLIWCRWVIHLAWRFPTWEWRAACLMRSEGSMSMHILPVFLLHECWRWSWVQVSFDLSWALFKIYQACCVSYASILLWTSHWVFSSLPQWSHCILITSLLNYLLRPRRPDCILLSLQSLCLSFKADCRSFPFSIGSPQVICIYWCWPSDKQWKVVYWATGWADL